VLLSILVIMLDEFVSKMSRNALLMYWFMYFF